MLLCDGVLTLPSSSYSVQERHTRVMQQLLSLSAEHTALVSRSSRMQVDEQLEELLAKHAALQVCPHYAACIVCVFCFSIR